MSLFYLGHAGLRQNLKAFVLFQKVFLLKEPIPRYILQRLVPGCPNQASMCPNVESR